MVAKEALRQDMEIEDHKRFDHITRMQEISCLQAHQNNSGKRDGNVPLYWKSYTYALIPSVACNIRFPMQSVSLLLDYCWMTLHLMIISFTCA